MDQRQHIGKARQIGAEFASTLKTMPRSLWGEDELFGRRVNSQTEADDPGMPHLLVPSFYK